ncbi:MMPL family transporter [Corynebacterium pyruviciproducens]|uniref:MMPL family transporter n=1 Tax=Corynebacterium pyruviciproducens TaxID=598660 RepID=A0AAF1BS38_9CORY|nr:MMPL family transporter [Corynebacterium pyruviciproducens]WOT01864.1 MMPL family transporter [Corynebacterium pyruviciproducens]
MAKFLFKVGRWSYRKKWWVIACWTMILAAVLGSAGVFQKGFSNDFNIPGTPSYNAAMMIEDLWPGQPNPVAAASVNIVFQAPEGETLDEPQNMAAMDATINYIKENLTPISGTEMFANPITFDPLLKQGVIDGMVSAGLPEETATEDANNVGRVSADKTIAYTGFNIDVPTTGDVTDEHRMVINEAIRLGQEGGLRVEANGSGFADPITIKTTSEAIGVIVALMVLIITFGSVVAAGVPILTALPGVGLGMGAILLTTRFVSLNNTTPVLAMMIGLAVGIDYALFILARFRAEKRRMPWDEAAGMAVGTAGSSIVFAGTTVFVALIALTLVRIPFLSWMGISAAFTVLVAVLVALTLLPAIMGVFGGKVFGWQPAFLRRRQEKLQQPEARTLGRRWVETVHRVPGLFLVGVVIALGLMSTPVLHLNLALPVDAVANKETTQRQASDLMQSAFGPGIDAPFLVVVDGHNVNTNAEALQPFKVDGEVPREAAYMYIVQQLKTHPDVKHVQIAGLNEDGTGAQLLLTPRTGPTDHATTRLLESLRSQQQAIEEATGVTMGVTGLTPIMQDITTQLEKAMPIYLLVVVGLAIVLLFIVFRSIAVPIVAGLGFLLSVGSAFGVTILVWQDGLWGLVGTPGPLVSFMPIFLIGICFGLAMDYQVFLVTRMREHFVKHGSDEHGAFTPTEASVVEGFTLGARVVTAAALIMIAVFIASIDQPLPFVKVFGFALAFGVLFDAFFVRMTLVPAAMFLLGRATWYMPKWLDRILPTIDIEGEQLEKEYELSH